jgi:hypothetical protein
MHPIVVLCFALAFCAFVASCSKQPSNKESTVTHENTKVVTFGHRQIDQMLADRPDMVGILNDDHPILLWIIDGMNGEQIGQRIYWNSDSPQNTLAQHFPGYDGYPPHIRLTGGTEATGIDKWAGLVYELFNLENTKAFHELFVRASEGELDRDAYAKECANLEYLALKKTEKFFQERPLPNAQPGHNARYDEMRQPPPTFEDFFARFTISRESAESYYDNMIVPYIESQRQSDE